MEQKPFERGEWVFWSYGWRWVEVYGREPSGIQTDCGLVASGELHRDPHSEIPPKPKKMVTKEARLIRTGDNPAEGLYAIFGIPPGATDLRCTYDIEEG